MSGPEACDSYFELGPENTVRMPPTAGIPARTATNVSWRQAAGIFQCAGSTFLPSALGISSYRFRFLPLPSCVSFPLGQQDDRAHDDFARLREIDRIDEQRLNPPEIESPAARRRRHVGEWYVDPIGPG